MFIVEDWNLPAEMAEYKPILLDANVLIGISRVEERYRDIDQLARNWKRRPTTSAVFVADFIKIEAFNAERNHYLTSKVRAFLKEVEDSANGFYVEVKTPIKKIAAEKRTQYLDQFPKKDRHVLLENYKDLSGTDICLLVMSVHMRDNSVQVTLGSSDKRLVAAAEALEVNAKYL